MKGWWYYYFVALAVKVPSIFWLLVAARLALGRDSGGAIQRLRGSLALPRLVRPGVRQAQRLGGSLALPVFARAHRYVPQERSAICCRWSLCFIWPSRPRRLVAQLRRPLSVAAGPAGDRLGVGTGRSSASTWKRSRSPPASLATVSAIWSIHPYELTYFNELAGGRIGGRHILADSNLDWGQGLKSLARLQQERPELCDLTLYYFGDTEPAHYGVAGQSYVVNAVDDHSRLPGLATVDTAYVAVSASLEWGPWGPRGFFDALKGLTPVVYNADTTIAIYRTNDVMDAIRVF